jgi:hypothetical protein
MSFFSILRLRISFGVCGHTTQTSRWLYVQCGSIFFFPSLLWLDWHAVAWYGSGFYRAAGYDQVHGVRVSAATAIAVYSPQLNIFTHSWNLVVTRCVDHARKSDDDYLHGTVYVYGYIWADALLSLYIDIGSAASLILAAECAQNHEK